MDLKSLLKNEEGHVWPHLGIEELFKTRLVSLNEDLSNIDPFELKTYLFWLIIFYYFNFSHDMNKVEQENYQILYEKIKVEIEKAKRKIVESKIELQEARKIRKNRQEYDVLSRQIQNYPDRSEMENTIKALEEKMEHLKKVDAEYNKKIDLRRKQFSVVLQSLSSLKGLIETDLKPEDIINRTQFNQLNEEAIGIDILLGKDNKMIAKTNAKNVDEDMEDDTDSTHNSKREKHYSVSESYME